MAIDCRGLTVGLIVVACTLMAGCGSGGIAPANRMPGDLGPAEETISLGTLQVGVTSAAGFRTKVLSTPANGRVAFTALYGSRIIRLQENRYSRIAISSDRDGDFEIYVMNLDGSGVTSLTQNTALDEGPSWSPDGRKVAFYSDRDGNQEVYVMNADGSGQTNLTQNAAVDRFPSWSPDGRKIAFSTNRDGNYEVYVMNADGSGQTNLTHDGATDDSPAWSADSRKIAFSTNRDGDYEVYVMNADGSGPANLTQNAAGDLDPSWSPDGREIAFRSDRDGDFDVYIMDADGSDPTNVTQNEVSDLLPSWSPDGRMIAFQSTRDGNREIYVVGADGGGQTNVTNDGAWDAAADWSPTPAVNRSIIGSAGSDGGSDPPFGQARGLAIVGITRDGLASAATIGTATRNWPTIDVAPVEDVGMELVAAQVTVAAMGAVHEDRGRGRPVRVWDVKGSPNPGAVLIFFDAVTGQIASVLAVADVALAEGPASDVVAEAGSGTIHLTGRFTEAYDSRDPSLDLVDGKAEAVTLDARTGEVRRVR